MVQSVTQAQGHFAQAPTRPHPRSVFDRSHGVKTAIDAGVIYPVLCDEVLPGDTFSMQAAMFGRFATLIRPVLDNVFLDIQFFFVPMRLCWDNFQKFMGEVNPGDTTEYTVPTFTDAYTPGEESLGDYFGIPIGVPLDGVNCLPFRAYTRVWNEWFRHAQLQDEVALVLDDGPDDPADYALLPRGKRYDYFTSALPWPLRGGVEVPLPLGSTAPIVPDTLGTPTMETAAAVSVGRMVSGGGGAAPINMETPPAGAGPLHWLDPQLVADLSGATAATLNDLRESIALQQLLEREARGGIRYVEILKSAWGVTSSDARLQRSEYLGGGTVPLQVNQVAATFGNGFGNHPVVGNLAAYGTMLMRAKGFTKSFEEHGYVLGLISFRADLNYQQGLHRKWSRQTKYDFPWPEFMHLGEQEVLSKEIFADGSANDEDVFGYQERYAEWRYSPSQVTGVMRSQAATSLDVWHLAQEFASRPTLGDTFIQENPPISRVIATPTEPQLLVDLFFRYRCARSLPTYSVPGLERF